MCAKSEARKKTSKKLQETTDFSSPFPPAWLFCGCFSGFPHLLHDIRGKLERRWGPVAAVSPVFNFPDTRLYRASMGTGLKRIFYVFDSFFTQDCLAEVKQETGRIEAEIAEKGSWPVQRPINLDPGLLTEGHIVLASTKERGHRLPRRNGIYEEITLLFFNGAFQTLMWTYTDWQSEEYRSFFHDMRKEFLEKSRTIRKRYL